MLLQIKIYMIGIMYVFGMMFMMFFPPRNYKQSGAKMRTKRSADIRPQYNHYVSHKELIDAAKRMASDDPEVINVVPLKPNTAGNRTLVALELHSDKFTKKPGILIIGALDGMAWGVPSAILELAERLLYDSNYQVPFFNDYDWYLVPMSNPDGLHFTQSLRSRPPLDVSQWSRNATAAATTRPSEWHKNVDNETEQPGCFGTHINRNFAYHWQDDVHKTPDRCSQFYPGKKPFSTAEAKAIRQYIDNLGEDINLAVHLHSSFVEKKELLLYPWRFSQRQLSNYQQLQSIGEYAARNARLPDNRLYQVHQSSTDPEGRVAGSLIDYLAGVVGVELVYVLKPYHQLYPSYSDTEILETYMNKAMNTILGLVRGWRSSDKHNTLSFFGKIIEF